ncbi:SDR family oxidoreductase, partial [Thermodesulfobacteriota bacterium]
CIRCAREVLPHMRNNQWGRIIIVAGMSARVVSPISIDSGPICGALANFGKQLANQEAGHGILVNTIHPGPTLTPRLEWAFKHIAQKEGTTAEVPRNQMEQRIPIGRIINPEDIANLALFLCSQGASAITGQSIGVDGGYGTGIIY